MVRPVIIADEKLLSYLLDLAKIEGFVPGLIVGQCTQQKDYVVHLARTPLPDSCRSTEGVEDSMPSGDNLSVDTKKVLLFSDIEENWLRTHARTVTRMLPGGMWILGVFLVGPEDIFANKNYVNKVSSLVTHVNNSVNSNTFLYGQNPNRNQLVLFFNSRTTKYTCKSYNLENLNVGVKAADWKFQPHPTDWYEVNCCYNLSKISPLYLTKEKANYPLKLRFKEILALVNENVDKALCTIDGQFRESSEALTDLKSLIKHKKDDDDKESTPGKKSRNTEKSFKANLYVLQEVKKEDDKIDVQYMESVCDLECNGYISSRVYLHQKATVEEATKAIKEDIIRSWAARLEMHWDTYEEQPRNEKRKGKKEVHIPPRRVICPLPYSTVSISEYVFPDEAPLEALGSIEEQFGYHVNPDSLNQTFERQYDAHKTPGVHYPPELSGGGGGGGGSRAGSTTGRRMPSALVIGIIIAALILLLSIAVQFSSYTGSSGDR